MNPKFFFLFLLVISLSNNSRAQQTVIGLVVSTEGKLLEYVSIGVLGGRTGTVSNTDGIFQLTLSDAEIKETLRFSCIGFKSKDIKGEAIDFSQPLKITLEKDVYELETVTVDARKYKKTKVLGSKSNSNSMAISFYSSIPGTAIGLPIRIKKEETWIREANFNIAQNTFGRVLFRIKIYDLKGSVVGKELLKENVIVETDMKSGELSVDLSQHNLIVNNDILLSLEWIGKYRETGEMSFCGNLLSGPVFTRRASQSNWHNPDKSGLINLGVGFNVLASY